MSTALPAASVPGCASSAASSAWRALRIIAIAGIALVIVIVVSSAYLRLSGAGLSCSDWPACYGRIATAAEPTAWERIARTAHRIAATGAAAITLALVVVAWVARPRSASSTAFALAALFVVVALAILGIATPRLAAAGPLLPAVTLANLLGGLALLALLAGAWASTLPRAGAPFWMRTLARLALVIVCGQVVLGGYVSARFAGLACPTFPLCGADVHAASLPALLDPFAPLAVDPTGSVVRTPDLAALQWAHRVGAHAVLFAAIALAIGLFRHRRRALAAAVIAPVIVALALGASAVNLGLPLPVVLAHNVVAALLLAAFVAVNVRMRTTG
jgi:cytochrome c oxidase assembly protein subunit 15